MFGEQKKRICILCLGENVLRFSTRKVISFKKKYHTPNLCECRLKKDNCTILHGCRKKQLNGMVRKVPCLCILVCGKIKIPSSSKALGLLLEIVTSPHERAKCSRDGRKPSNTQSSNRSIIQRPRKFKFNYKTTEKTHLKFKNV